MNILNTIRTLTLVTTLLLAGCNPQSGNIAQDEPDREPQRFAWVTGLKPEKADYYEELHANPWPGVTEMIEEANIRNFSIHKVEIEGKLYLFAYLEYIGDDFEADMAKMAEDPETQRWWKETDPCQIPLPQAAATGAIWADTEEVFFQK